MPELVPRLNGELPTMSADEAASLFGRGDTVVVSGFGSVGYPKAVPLALTERDEPLELTLISGGSVGNEIDVDLVKSGHITRRFPYQSRRASRDRINAGEMAFHDRHISRLGAELKFENFGPVDVAVVEAVSLGEDWLIPSMSIGSTPAFIETADRLVVEVNEAQPQALQRIHDVYRRGRPPKQSPIPLQNPNDRIGEPRIRFDSEKLVAVVRTNRPDDTFTFKKPDQVYRTIAANLREFLAEEMERNPIYADAMYFQFGVGSLGNALMGALEELDFGDREAAYFGEVIQDGLLRMLESDSFSFASATSLALSEEGRSTFFDNLDSYVEDVVLRPASLSNSPALIERFGVVAINSALEVDIYGNVNSTHVGGSKVLNAIGGSGDFNRHSPVAITALPSQTANGEVSRIVPMAPHVDHTEHDVDVIVTEQGVADLRGLVPTERAQVLIDKCAHPNVRPDLREYVAMGESNGGHIPTDLETAFDWHLSWQVD